MEPKVENINEILKQAAKICLTSKEIRDCVMLHIRYGGGLSAPDELLKVIDLKDAPLAILKFFKNGGMPFETQEDKDKIVAAKLADPMIEVLQCEAGAMALMTETIK